jgi:hypothetical protein
MNPKAMPSVIENVKGIITMVKNDATATGGSFQLEPCDGARSMKPPR